MIKGITPALAEGGKIKIGGLGQERPTKSGGTFRMPEKYNHFVITTTRRNDKGDLERDHLLEAALDKDADGKIRAIPIALHSDRIEEVFPNTYAIYESKKLLCRGDGETAHRWKMEGGKRSATAEVVTCPCPLLDENKCKPHGTLHCSIRAHNRAVAGSVHYWRTTSLISVQRVIGSLQQILATVGTLRGLPLWLVLEPVNVSPNGTNSTVYVCHIELRAADIGDVQMRAIEAAKTRQALGAGKYEEAYRALVKAPAADDEPEDEQARIGEEFYPVEPEAEVSDEQKELRQTLIGTLETAAGYGKKTLQDTWLAMTAEQRALVGNEEKERVKGMVKE